MFGSIDWIENQDFEIGGLVIPRISQQKTHFVIFILVFIQRICFG
jgi:hypothetical protein